MSVGYQLEQLTERGHRDDALYLAGTTLDDLLGFYVADGYSDDEITELITDRLGDIRAEL